MPERECRYCEGDDFFWAYETVSGHPNDPNGNGWEVLCCSKCGCAVPDDFTSATRRWVGC